MPVARVVTFEGVDTARIEELRQRMQSGEPPEGMPAAEMLLLHDPDASKSLAIVIFDNEDDYRQGDAVLGAMPTEDTPGRRTDVSKYEVAVRVGS
jgi:hypothetical protein